MWPADFDPTFAPTQADAPAYQFAFVDEALLLEADNTLPSAERLAALGRARADFVVGALAGMPCRARWWPAAEDLPAGLQAVGLRDVFSLLPVGQWGVAARARQMLRWDLGSRFCGACGSATEPVLGEPAKHCPACANREYPRIAPAVMALVRRGDQLLLARSPHFRPGMYSALAGFVEAGETVESCLHREVFEETGIRIKNLRWFASQPWPFPYSLMLAFHADYAGGDIVPQPGEIEDAGWYSIDALPGMPAPVSIASRLIHAGIAEIQRDLTASGQAQTGAQFSRFDPANNNL